MLILKPSKIHEIGVFTTEPIKKGASIDSHLKEDVVFYSEIPKDIPKDVFMKYSHQGDGGWYAPQDFEHLSAGWFFNHSDTPNIKTSHNDTYRANRDIGVNEELTINYKELE